MYLSRLHQYGPWVLLALGVFGLLQVTVFYQTIQRLHERMLNSALVKEAFLWTPLVGRLIRRSALFASQSAAMRWLTTAMSLAYLGGAVVWFALRP